MSRSFLLEIGTEQIPFDYLDDFIKKMSDENYHLSVKNIFEKEYKIPVSGISIYATPRRIVIYIKDVSQKQLISDNERLIKGPPYAVCYDEKGNLTPALKGFLQKNNKTQKDINIIEIQNRKYVTVLKPIQKTEEFLPSIAKKIILFPFPKFMKWDNSGLKFPRPVRWILAFYGNKKLKFSVGKIKTANITYGIELPVAKKIKIKNVDDYFKKIADNGIILSQQDRKEMIRTEIKKNSVYINETLLTEVTFLTESPFFIQGEFDRKYCFLPQEVLVASMSKNQRIFSLLDKNNNIIPAFIGVINGKSTNKKVVKSNYESILEAKLKDSMFFYNEDLKEPLINKTILMEKIVFHKELGSIQDKINRELKVAKSLVKQVGLSKVDYKFLNRAIILSKADLTTHMVGEFPDLQGIMGAEYARKTGENEKVATAIYEHYLPKHTSDKLPQTKIGSLLAILDKMDLIVGCFIAGLIPSGSLDPYALRRNAMGVVQIAINNRINFSFDKLITEIINSFIGFPIKTFENDKQKKEQVKKQLKIFFRDRVITAIGNNPIVQAVVNSGFDNFYSVYNRVQRLTSIKGEENLSKAAKIVERTKNIIKSTNVDINKIDEKKFKEKEEKRLWDLYCKNKERISKCIVKEEYVKATDLYAKTFADAIHDFFENVLVNTDDTKIKNNRLALMKAINLLYSEKIADISLIAEKG